MWFNLKKTAILATESGIFNALAASLRRHDQQISATLIKY
jgi:hypothetical protein